MEKVEEFKKGRFEEEIQRIRLKKGKEIKLNLEAEEFKRGELPGRYTTKLLYRWDDKKFDEEYLKKLEKNWNRCVTNFIQLISPQPVDRFSQTKLHWKAPNEGYPHICGMYKSNNERLRYQAISSCKSFIC